MVVDSRAVFLEDVPTLLSGCVLQLEDCFGVEEVILPFTSPLIFATRFELPVCSLLGAFGVRPTMAHGNGGCDFVEADSAEAAHGASEIRIDRVFADADRFKDLGAGI